MKLTCPFCYENFDSSKIIYRCDNTDDVACPKEDDHKLAQYFGQKVYLTKRVVKNGSDNGSLFRWFKKSGNSIKCDSCKKPTSKRICPSCHNQLPTFFHQAESHIISIIGARNSGKTHYITMLINELVRQGHLLKIRTVPQDVGENRNEVTSKRYKNSYKRPLIDNLKELPQTQENAKDLYPLIYEIVSNQKNITKKQVLYLTFYDTAGENFRDTQELKKLANYVSNSSGVIFLVDTFQIPTVKSYLKRNGMNLPDFNTDYHEVLYQIIDIFQQQGFISKAGGQTKVPIAITLSKFDEVLQSDLLGGELVSTQIETNSSFLSTGKYSELDIKEFSEIIKYNLNDNWEERAFVNDVETTFKVHSFFGVSSLGNSPVNGKLIHGAPNPFRVMDPLLWILDNLKFSLPKTK